MGRLEEYILINEPAFEHKGIQYSVCYASNTFGTWDSTGTEGEYRDIDDLLDHWIVGGVPFREVAEEIFF